MIKKISYITSTVALATPAFVFASGQNLETLAGVLIKYLNEALIILMGVALVFFVWNVIKYFIRANEDHKEAAPYVMWSVIGFFVILSVWGIVNILKNTFFGSSDVTAPTWSSFSHLFPSGTGGGGGGYGDVTSGE